LGTWEFITLQKTKRFWGYSFCHCNVFFRPLCSYNYLRKNITFSALFCILAKYISRKDDISLLHCLFHSRFWRTAPSWESTEQSYQERDSYKGLSQLFAYLWTKKSKEKKSASFSLVIENFAVKNEIFTSCWSIGYIQRNTPNI
jgi:hypothetical protein